MEDILLYLKAVGLTTIWLLIIYVAPAVMLSIIVHFSSSIIEKESIRIFGIHIYLYLFGWIGTACHELGHALFCVIFRHKITDIKLFSPDTKTGTLGYVSHTYEPGSIYQTIGNFFIGIGPILLGSLVIYLTSILLLDISFDGSVELVSSLQNCFQESFSKVSQMKLQLAAKTLQTSLTGNLDTSSWKFYVFLYIAFSIGSSITLSWSDIKGATGGFLILILFITIINLATLWLWGPETEPDNAMIPAFAAFYTVLIFTITLNTLASLVLITISTIKGR